MSTFSLPKSRPLIYSAARRPVAGLSPPLHTASACTSACRGRRSSLLNALLPSLLFLFALGIGSAQAAALQESAKAPLSAPRSKVPSLVDLPIEMQQQKLRAQCEDAEMGHSLCTILTAKDATVRGSEPEAHGKFLRIPIQ